MRNMQINVRTLRPNTFTTSIKSVSAIARARENYNKLVVLLNIRVHCSARAYFNEQHASPLSSPLLQPEATNL